MQRGESMSRVFRVNPALDIFNNPHFAEYMVTSDEQISAVTCFAEAREYSALCAQTCVQGLLTFFRGNESGDLSSLDDNSLSEYVIGAFTNAVQAGVSRIGAAGAVKSVKIAATGFFTTPDDIIVFIYGEDNVFVQLTDGSVQRINPTLGSRIFSRGANSVSITRINKCDIRGLLIASGEVKNVDGLMRYAAGCDGDGFDQNRLSDGTFSAVYMFLKPRNESTVKVSGSDNAARIYRASITGESHIKYGDYCQDYCDYAVFGGRIVAAISDGAGGANHSEYGSRINIENVIDCVRRAKVPTFDAELCETVLASGAYKLKSFSQKFGIDLPQLSATMIAVYVAGSNISWMHVGDGAVFGLMSDGRVQYLSEADNISDISNRTYFTVDPDVREHLRKGYIHRDSVDMLMVVTDGVYNGIPTQNQTAFAAEVFSRAKDQFMFGEEKLAANIDIQPIRRYGDDHSAILINLSNGRARRPGF